MKITKQMKSKQKALVGGSLFGIRIILATPLNDEDATDEEKLDCTAAYEALEHLEKYFNEKYWKLE